MVAKLILHYPQNVLIELFNGTYRREILNAYTFRNLGEVRRITNQ